MSAGSEPTVTVVIGSNAPPERSRPASRRSSRSATASRCSCTRASASPAAAARALPVGRLRRPRPDRCAGALARRDRRARRGELVALTIAPDDPGPGLDRDDPRAARRARSRRRRDRARPRPAPRRLGRVLLPLLRATCRPSRRARASTSPATTPRTRGRGSRASATPIETASGSRTCTGGSPTDGVVLWQAPDPRRRAGALRRLRGLRRGSGSQHGRAYGHQRGVAVVAGRATSSRVLGSPARAVRDDARASLRARLRQAAPSAAARRRAAGRLRLQRRLGPRRGARARRRAPPRERPELSVVVASVNGLPYLADCLDALERARAGGRGRRRRLDGRADARARPRAVAAT